MGFIEIAKGLIIHTSQLPELQNPSNIKKNRPKPSPPRSMTAEELDYYRKHKTLEGYKPNSNK